MNKLYGKSTTIDFDFDMKVHPVTKDLVLKRDSAAISQAMKNLVLSGYGEIIDDPNIGGGVLNTLFDLADSITAFKVRQAVSQTIANHEPRADVRSVEVYQSQDAHHLHIVVTYYFASNPEPEVFHFSVERSR